MAENNLQKEQLTSLLQQLPDRTPPAGLVGQIVKTVTESKKQYCRPEKSDWFSFPLWGMLWPRQLAGALCVLVLVFSIGFTLGENKKEHIAQAPAAQFPEYVYQNAQAGFLVGRGLLAAGKEAEALAILQHASQLSPENPEYLFWLGTTHWRMGDTAMEQLSYRKAVKANPVYLPALVNLGHNLLENKESEEALQTYKRVLAIAPGHKVALYNSALATHITGNSDQAISAWKRYLSVYRSGKWAQRAVQHLNGLGDFSYRAYQIGVRQIIVNQDVLLGSQVAVQKLEVQYLAEVFRQAPVSELYLTLFYAGAEEKAKKQAITLKSLLNDSLQNHNKRIQISWFAEPEAVQTASGMKSLVNGLLIFGQLQLSQVQGESI